MKNTPKALTRPGAITAHSVSVHCRSIMSMYSGMTPSCTGTIIVAITATRRTLAALNSSFAKANPASVEKNTTEAVTVRLTTAELIRAASNGTVVNTRSTFATRFAPGSTGGGIWPSAELSREATTTL